MVALFHINRESMFMFVIPRCLLHWCLMQSSILAANDSPDEGSVSRIMSMAFVRD